jgi:hypothetical protein
MVHSRVGGQFTSRSLGEVNDGLNARMVANSKLENLRASYRLGRRFSLDLAAVKRVNFPNFGSTGWTVTDQVTFR